MRIYVYYYLSKSFKVCLFTSSFKGKKLSVLLITNVQFIYIYILLDWKILKIKMKWDFDFAFMIVCVNWQGWFVEKKWKTWFNKN